MTWEVGKFYKTRDGSKARIYCLDGGGFIAIHGAILIPSGWTPVNWNKYGKSSIFDPPQPLDLTEEWKEHVLSEPYYAWGEIILGVVTLKWLSKTDQPVTGNMIRLPWLDPPKDWRPDTMKL